VSEAELVKVSFDAQAAKERLVAIAEELADGAIERLKVALEEGDELASAQERAITRARRSVEKAVALLEDL